MDPNTGQPVPPQQGSAPEPSREPYRPAPGAGIPDWQQGLGQAPQPPASPYAVQGPAIGATPSGVPSNMPAHQPVAGPPQPWQPPSASAPGEISMTSPGVVDYAAVASRNRKLPLIVGGVIVLLILAAITYVAFFRGSAANNTTGQSSQSSNSGDADMAALYSATLELPDTVEGYSPRQTGTSSIQDYVAADGSCELIIGTVTAAQLPGTSLETLVKPQLDQLRENGAAVQGPEEGQAFVVKDAVNASKTYRLPTITFAFSQGKKHAAVHYSAIIMKNGDRAVINRVCINENGDVDTNKLKAVDETAKKVMIRPTAKP